jgi:hypothetical protein
MPVELVPTRRHPRVPPTSGTAFYNTMLEKPDLHEARIADWLNDHYGLRVVEVEFLPTGYQNTAAYHVVTEDRKAYFLKLRRDVFEEPSVTLPLSNGVVEMACKAEKILPQELQAD